MQFEYKTLKQLINLLATEKIAHRYFASKRWYTGVINCPFCQHEKVYVFKDGIRYKCKNCKKQFNVRTGSFTENSKVPLSDWAIAMHLILHKKGISSVQLAKDIGVTQTTAWYMLHRIRGAMGNEQPETLKGTVEIDEAFVGGRSYFKHKKKRPKYNPGRSWSDKVPVMGLIERGGRLKALVVSDVQMLTLHKTVHKYIEPGSNIMVDGYSAYRSLSRYFNVQSVDHGAGWFVNGEIHTNTIEGFWSQFKKGIKSTYHRTSKKHLQKYVDEFVFKYNYRNLDTQKQVECLLRNLEYKSSKLAA